MGSSGSAPDATPEDARRAFAASGGPNAPLTATDVADELECDERAARSNLERLVEEGRLRSREVGGTRVWWRPVDQGDPSDRQSNLEEFGAFVSAVEDYAIFMLDPDGVVVSWNEGAERIKGYEQEEIVGQHFSTFYTDEDAADGVPDRNLEAASRDGRVEDEGWRVRADGERFWADVVITAIRDDEGRLQGFTKVTRDMTERREYERRIRRQRDITEQIFETVPASIGLLTPEGEIVRANRRMLELIGRAPDALDDHSVRSWDLYDEEGEPIPESERPWNRAVETGETIDDFPCRVELPEVGRRWLSINAAPIDDGPRSDEDRVVVSVDDVTERRERERELRREYRQTEKLLRTAPMAVSVRNAEGETVMANRRARETLGRTERDDADRSDGDDEWTVYDADGTPIPPDEMPSARVFETGEAVSNEEVAIDPPDGDRMEFRLNAAPVVGSDGTVQRVVTAGEDITELKRRERQLERRKTELETELGEILDRISDAFYALDDEWRFTHLNDRAAEIVQRDPDELLGRSIWTVFPDEDDVYREKFTEAMETQESVSFEVFMDDLDAWLEFNAYPSESGLSVYFRDVTDRIERERKLEESNERLEQFAYAASHDLQEPLRMVSSYLSLIERRYGDELDEDGREFLEFAVDGADRMRDMIEGLLAYSRVDTRGDPFEPVDLDDVLEDVREDLRVKIDESDAAIEVESLPTVDGDPRQLRQLFQNLLDNAIEYSGDDPPRVSVAAERRGEEWLVSVSDEGVGIDPRNVDRVFEVFQSLHGPEEHSGTGIGLALCQRIVERHGGDVSVESEPGEGSTFSVTLPAAGETDD